MKIAIIGYGAMGKEVENVCKQQNIPVTDIFDIGNPLNSNEIYDFDVAIDFSHPKSVLDNIRKLAYHKKNVVVGTTGWYSDIDTIRQIIADNNIGLVWASNFSIGVQLFFKLVKEMACLFNNFENYDSFISEIHHKNKADAPSGTALSLAKILLDNLDSKTQIVSENLNRKISPNELHVSSLRGGSIFGQHDVFFDSEADTIKLSHSAKSRQGFAEGATLAAKFIFDRKGFYNFEDILF